MFLTIIAKTDGISFKNAELCGGILTDSTWTTKATQDYIEWPIETCPQGKIEFDVTGIYASNNVFPNPVLSGDADVHYCFLNMFDADPNNEWYGQNIDGVVMWHNPYKAIMHLFGYSYGDLYKWKTGRFRLNVAAFKGGYDDDPHAFEMGYGPIEWEKDRVYHIALEWGNGHMVYSIDGQVITDCDYSSFGVEYAPPYHTIRLGSTFKLGSGTGTAKGMSRTLFQAPVGITFSNLTFNRFEDNDPPQVVRHYSDNRLDTYISITMSEPVDEETIDFQIEPFVSGIAELHGNTISYELKEPLEKDSQYLVTLKAVSDKSGNGLVEPFSFIVETPANSIPLFGIFEIISKQPGTAVFQHEDQSIEVKTFDCIDFHKVRFSPTSVGTWNYTFNGTLGTLRCVASNSYHVKQSTGRPYQFITTQGEPWAWKGETSWRAFTHLLPFEGRYKEYIDLRASQGYTAVQSIVVSYINGDKFWANEGGTAFDCSGDGKNYDEIGHNYYKWIDRRIEYANSKGITPVVFVTWADEFVKFSSSQFENYLQYLVNRWAAYDIIWVICGEYNEAYASDLGNVPPETFRGLGEYLYSIDPYKHLISYHPSGRGSCAEFAWYDWLGFVMQQKSIEFTNAIKKDRIYDKPVVNGEYCYAGYHDNDDAGRGAWEIFTSGGFYTAGFYRTFAPDKGGWDTKANQREQDAVSTVNRYIDLLPWWTMETNGNVLSNGMVSISYKENGGSSTGLLIDPLSGEIIRDDSMEHVEIIGLDLTSPSPPEGLVISR